ncbi:hypothetical protein WOLCODRAFT_164063 [Wolfiporia cocos MD-104 SS10]|uniref:Uncharacterized protein n=1 Tax=Wolfiporia cocos (strain MD-104) TaxID=742152 RepID=A0A2H3JKZ0_WOLCO|nr:hypothetical protein WOLCODRAFT_164063 [Wolfiporia cocos MD-104 SS10]
MEQRDRRRPRVGKSRIVRMSGRLRARREREAEAGNRSCTVQRPHGHGGLDDRQPPNYIQYSPQTQRAPVQAATSRVATRAGREALRTHVPRAPSDRAKTKTKSDRRQSSNTPPQSLAVRPDSRGKTSGGLLRPRVCAHADRARRGLALDGGRLAEAGEGDAVQTASLVRATASLVRATASLVRATASLVRATGRPWWLRAPVAA